MANANYTINRDTHKYNYVIDVVAKSTTGFTLNVYADIPAVGYAIETFNGAQVVALNMSVNVMGRQ